MCRFLLAESEQPFNPQDFVAKFANMSEASKSYDGDWQGDGAGIAWMENGVWKVNTTLEPFWENESEFSQVSLTNKVLMHARSASFPNHKGVPEYNQPYISEQYAFVFNGLLKGVKLPFKVEGAIGAQKIWSLLQHFLRDNNPVNAMQITVELLNEYSREIQALNIGLADEHNIYCYSQFNSHPDYYNLQVYETDEMKIVCSEGLEGMEFEKVETEKVFKF